MPNETNGFVATSSTKLGEWSRSRKMNFLGIGISVLDRASLLSILAEALRTRSRLTVSFLNPNYALAAAGDPQLRERINRFDIVLADGMGIVWGGRLLRVPIPERLGNDDLTADLFDLLAEAGYRAFLFGSAPGVAKKAASNLAQRYPGFQAVGTLHGWFDVLSGHPGWYDEQDNELILRRINETDPDLLLVGVPTPIQQEWVFQNADRLKASVIITGGSYLDHLAERMQWYPGWIQKLRLNWLYRLWRDPRRLWRRYSVEIMEFFWLVLKTRFNFSR